MWRYTSGGISRSGRTSEPTKAQKYHPDPYRFSHVLLRRWLVKCQKPHAGHRYTADGTRRPGSCRRRMFERAVRAAP